MKGFESFYVGTFDHKKMSGTFLIFLFVTMFALLLWYQINAPSIYTSVYIPFATFGLVLLILGLIAMNVPTLKGLPFAVLGLGNLDEKFGPISKFTAYMILGLVFGLALSANVVNQLFMSVEIPVLGIEDKATNQFMTCIAVPIIEEMSTVAVIVPSVGNLVAQSGISGLLGISALLSMFFFSGWNIIGSVGLLLLAFYVRNYRFKPIFIVLLIVAVLVDATFFASIHYKAYGLDASKLTGVFMYRIVADIITVMTGSILPALLAHVTNNTIKYGIREAMGLEALAPIIVFMIMIYIAYRWTNKEVI